MSGSIKINTDDFDKAYIPNECILTDMSNKDSSEEYNPILI